MRYRSRGDPLDPEEATVAGNRVVARYRNGKLVKGTTVDFLPKRDFFHVQSASGAVTTIQHSELKAVFFVRDLVGNERHFNSNFFDAVQPAQGRKIRVVFADGEVLVGTTQGYDPGRPGFFLIPADPACNNERCFVIATATRRVEPL